IAELVLERRHIVARDRVGHFIGLFDGVWRDRRKILLAIPRTTMLWIAKLHHDFQQAVEGRAHSWDLRWDWARHYTAQRKCSVRKPGEYVSTKYRCHRLCHLQMSPASGRGAPRSASPTLQDRGGRFRRTPTGPRSTETHGDHSGVNDGSRWPHASRPLL